MSNPIKYYLKITFRRDCCPVIALGVFAKDIHLKRLVEWLSYSEFDSDKQK